MTAHTHPETQRVVAHRLAASLLDEALTLLGASVACGVDALPTRPPASTGRPLVWDAATIRAALQAFAQRTGRPPGPQEWRWATQYGLPARAAVVRVYGSLEAAYHASGLAMPASMRGQRSYER